MRTVTSAYQFERNDDIISRDIIHYATKKRGRNRFKFAFEHDGRLGTSCLFSNDLEDVRRLKRTEVVRIDFIRLKIGIVSMEISFHTHVQFISIN